MKPKKKEEEEDFRKSRLLEEIIKSKNLYIFLSNLLYNDSSSEITSHDSINQLYSVIFYPTCNKIAKVRL